MKNAHNRWKVFRKNKYYEETDISSLSLVYHSKSW